MYDSLFYSYDLLFCLGDIVRFILFVYLNGFYYDRNLISCYLLHESYIVSTPR